MSLSSLEKYYNQFLKIQDKTVNTILDLGRTVGSAIRRAMTRNFC